MSFTLNGVGIEDTFAEGFGMWGARIIITAKNRKWANIAAKEMTGFATSVIACDCEAGIERQVPPEETPDGRPGVSVMIFGFSKKRLSAPMLSRIGQCVLTCPTTASLRFFGDGFQVKMRMGDGWGERRRFWRIPVMEGEFLAEGKFGAVKAVAGGNFLVMGEDEDVTLEASERAVEAILEVPGVITPFPGGLCRSGSKVGSTYAFMKASTNTPFCPAIKHTLPDSQVPAGCNSVLEVILNGLDEPSVMKAMGAGIRAATEVEGVKWITAVNFGGKLGKFQMGLKDALGVE